MGPEPEELDGNDGEHVRGAKAVAALPSALAALRAGILRVVQNDGLRCVWLRPDNITLTR